MAVDSVFDGLVRGRCPPEVEGMDAVTAIAERSRVDLLRLLTGLRHLAGSTEPGRGFSEITQASAHRYRIRRPGPPCIREPVCGGPPAVAAVPADTAPGRPGEVTVAERMVAAVLGCWPIRDGGGAPGTHHRPVDRLVHRPSGRVRVG